MADEKVLLDVEAAVVSLSLLMHDFFLLYSFRMKNCAGTISTRVFHSITRTVGYLQGNSLDLNLSLQVNAKKEGYVSKLSLGNQSKFTI